MAAATPAPASRSTTTSRNAPAAQGTTPRAGFRKVLSDYLRAGYQIMFVPTVEESRVEAEVQIAAAETKSGASYVVAWDMFEGFTQLIASTEDGEVPPETLRPHPQLQALNTPAMRNPEAALRLLADPMAKIPKNCIFIFRDLDDSFMSPASAGIRRALRSLCEGNRLVNSRINHPIIIVSPSHDIHPKLRSALTLVEFTLPDENALDEVFEFVRTSITTGDTSKTDCSPALREKIVAALLGLTATEAENTLSLCVVQHDGFTDEVLRTIKNEKAQIVRKSEVLSYMDESLAANRNEIGGFENVLEHVRKRSRAYTRHARQHKLDYPKGIVLLGPPGTGKSMVAQALGKQMGMPVYIMDVGAVFGSLVGESEARMRTALKQIAAQQGCVLLIDEADKAWGGAHQSTGDSGVTQRVFSQLLTWLASKQDRTFVVMTMNRIKNVPAEFLRMGRFDAIFHTELPKPVERRTILEIHLRKRDVDPTTLGLSEEQWEELVNKTEGYVPSELEELVKEARSIAYDRFTEARDNGGPQDDPRAAVPTFSDFFLAAEQIVPLSRTAAEDLKAMADFCVGRSRPASSPVVKQSRRAGRAVKLD